MAKRITDPKRAVAYLRVSTEDQNLGPEAQRAAIEAWAARSAVAVLSWHVDHGVSGGASIESRPGLLAAIDAAGEGKAGLLVVAKRDRLARDVMLAAMTEQLLARHGARVASAAGEGTDAAVDDPSAQLMRTLVDVFAQYERALIRSRTKAALSVKKARGHRVGTVPYGMRLAADGTTLEIDPAEQAVIGQIQAWRAAGVSLRGIVAECERAGIVARSGKPLAQTQVVRILRVAA
ncbi:MAG TPA: recombinase family protein [Polyangiaceae bacterium]|nr:recombinase family protein [Polyangiaceae bacterium]